MELELFLRVGMACLFGGLIGMERESVNRPAGFRTHMLVCLGSAVVMLSNLILFEQYSGRTNMDPARFGAQVISGIGFLGAGTIIKEGFSVRGLTTAASLWAVACIGLVIGAGHYSLAVFSTIMVLVILEIFSRVEKRYQKNRRELVVYLQTANVPGQLGKVAKTIGDNKCRIRNISMSTINESLVELKVNIPVPKGIDSQSIITALADTEGVINLKIRE